MSDPYISVQPEWCRALSLQQQGVLLLGARGPDGVAKSHPCKVIQRAYRGTVFTAARYGRPLEWGERADSFMSLDLIADLEAWQMATDLFFETMDDLCHHYLMHFMHGAQILGYKHPGTGFRMRWGNFYKDFCDSLHLDPESEDKMDLRLNDWGREAW